MNTTDILLYESGDGGEMSIQNGDLAVHEVLYNQVYLALFGGNVEENTKNNYLLNEERFDYWANSLIWNNVQSQQFNSNTERTLRNVSLNSSGRLKIVQAVEHDLSYLSDLLNSTVSVEIISTDRVMITVDFISKTNQQNKTLQLIYNNAKNQIIIQEEI